MPSARIISENLAKKATVTLWPAFGTENTTFPVANLVNGKLSPECRITSNGSGEIIIRFDFGEATSINGVMIAKHNLQDSTTGPDYDLKLIGNDTDTPLSGSGTFVIACADDYFVKLRDNAVCFGTSYSRRYWFIFIETLTASTEYRIPEIWLANNTALTHHNTLPETEEIGGPFAVNETYGGLKRVVQFGNSSNFPALQWHSLTDTDVDQFETLHADCWPGENFWLIDFHTKPFYDLSRPSDEEPPGYFCQYNNQELVIESDGIGLYQLTVTAEELTKTVVIS